MTPEQLARIPDIEHLVAGLDNGAAQASPATEDDPIQEILVGCGLAALQQGTSMTAVEIAVRDLAACLAGADEVRRATVREAALKRLNEIGISAPARLLDAALQRQETTQASNIFFVDPESWPSQVDGAKLLDDIAEVLTAYVILPKHGAHGCALWILFTWVIESFDIAVILAILSAIKRSGKTTLLETISMLVPRPLMASNISPSAVFRSIEAFKPTLLIDEADTFLKDNEELRGVLNAGHRRSSAFVVKSDGDDHHPKQFCTWGAKAIALIGKLPSTLEDRSILIEMRRRAPGEKIQRFRSRTVKDRCEPLRRQAFRWTQDSILALRNVDVDLPPELNDRAADNWQPLLAIARHCGGKWPQRAKEAALALSVISDEAESSALIDLLTELKTLFENTDRITSANLAEHLGGQSETRWSEWHRGKPITPRQIAKLLQPLKIKPSSIRIGNETPRGYLAEWFEDAFSRYIPLFIRNNATSEENQKVTQKNDPPQNGHVADEKSGLSREQITNVADVADGSPNVWERIE